MPKPSWLKRAVGEISKLRTTVTGVLIGSNTAKYKLDSSKVNSQLARSLYNNTNDDYKLGAFAAKPVINTAVGFMGVPRFSIVDEDAQQFLDDFFGENTSNMIQTHKDSMIDGNCWVWLTWEEDEETEILYPEADGHGRLVFNFIPPDMIKETCYDPVTRTIVKVVLEEEFEWFEDKAKKKCTIIQTITKEERTIEFDGDIPEGKEKKTEYTYQWGFVPIVLFANEKDNTELNGKSELEPIEPYMKAYHDIAMYAMQGSQMHSSPKLKLKVKDIEKFLLYNKGITDIKKFIAEGGKLSFEGQDFFLMKDDEDAAYIEVKSATGSAKELLKLLFFCIVDISETPEFAFGTHTPSSQASVKEQMPILIRRVSRKRENFDKSWKRLARMALAMYAQSTATKFSSYQTTLIWDEIDPRDDKEIADTLKSIVEALAKALEAGIIYKEAAVNFLAQYIDTMEQYINDDPEIPGAREKIIRDKVRKNLLEDAELMDQEKNLIEEALKQYKTGVK